MLPHWLSKLLARAVPMTSILHQNMDKDTAIHIEAIAEQANIEQTDEVCRAALAYYPNCARIHELLGNTALIRQDWRIAIEHYELALKNSASDRLAPQYHRLAKAHEGLGEEEEARYFYELAILSPDGLSHEDLSGVYFRLGLASKSAREYDQAIEYFNRCLEISHENAEAHFYLGFTYNSLQRHEESILALHEALRIDPMHYGALNNIGHSLLNLDRYADARPFLERAVSIDPEIPRARVNLGLAYHYLGLFDAAEAEYIYVLQREPNNFDAKWYYTNLLLARRRWIEGWAFYESRFLVQGAVGFRSFHFSRWRGEELKGKTLLIVAEQGLGDEIMFASCYREVIDRADHCMIECEPRLERLFQRSFPEATVFGSLQMYAPEWLKQAAPVDVQIGAGSLPYFLRRSDENFPIHGGYLRAAPDTVEQWRQRLSELGPGLKIGISWRGGTAKTRAFSRSIPLEDWLPLLRLQNIHWISLQYGDCQADLERLQTRCGIVVHHWPGAIADYDQTAALVCALDLVLTVCTSLVHLTGALGKPGWVLAPKIPEWRYLLEGDSMPWYPSIRMFRNSEQDDWSALIESVRQSLLTHSTRNGSDSQQLRH